MYSEWRVLSFAVTLVVAVGCDSFRRNDEIAPILREDDAASVAREEARLSSPYFEVHVPPETFASAEQLSIGTVKADTLPKLSNASLLLPFYVKSSKRGPLQQPLRVRIPELARHFPLGKEYPAVAYLNPHRYGREHPGWSLVRESRDISGDLGFDIATIGSADIDDLPKRNIRSHESDHYDAGTLIFALITTEQPSRPCTKTDTATTPYCKYMQQTLPGVLAQKLLDFDAEDGPGLLTLLQKAMDTTAPIDIATWPPEHKMVLSPYGLGSKPYEPQLTLPTTKIAPAFDQKSRLSWEAAALWERPFAAYTLQLMYEDTFRDLWKNFVPDEYTHARRDVFVWGDEVPTTEQAFWEDAIDFIAYYLLVKAGSDLTDFLTDHLDLSPVERPSGVSITEGADDMADARRIRGTALLTLWDLVDDTPDEDPYAGSFTELMTLLFRQKPRSLIDLYYHYLTLHDASTLSPGSHEREAWLQQVFANNGLLWKQQVIVENVRRRRREDIEIFITMGKVTTHRFDGGKIRRDLDNVFYVPLSLGSYVVAARDKNGKVLGRCDVEITRDWANSHGSQAFREILYISPCFSSCRPSQQDLVNTLACE